MGDLHDCRGGQAWCWALCPAPSGHLQKQHMPLSILPLLLRSEEETRTQTQMQFEDECALRQTVQAWSCIREAKNEGLRGLDACHL